MVAHDSNLVLGSRGRRVRSRSFLPVLHPRSALLTSASFPPRLLPSSKCSPVKEASGDCARDLPLCYSLVVFLRVKSPLDVCPSVVDIPSHRETPWKEWEERARRKDISS